MSGFYAGWREEIDGIEYRCVQGRKSPEDLVVEHYTDTGWRRISFDTLAMLADFLYENEQRLYPPSMLRADGRPYAGGERVLQHLKQATAAGWEATRSQLRNDRANAQRRAVPAGKRAI